MKMLCTNIHKIQIYNVFSLALCAIVPDIPLSVVSIKLYKGHTPYVRIL